ncbi:TRAP transporter large permease [Stappia taiwanensis]|uniref:TRAP transporter large permease protein n=1 Tax=Stappia taiwanensis TaxID=992267 RepID=A0A838XWJ8_9HYPH|nr:TRAP transporter large permease [Stappia taiwanensis]MBA4612866.1 TRAP transporter large permease [Stappia taiwanensis]GGF07199.1 C4-dicarboxylate ABC transporter permease [Stappia taiwanensis]
METWLPGLVILLIVMFAGVPIAMAMAAVGGLGLAVILGFQPAMTIVGQTTFDTGLSYPLSVVPLFVLMGNLVTRAGLSDELYAACHAWLGHRRGGLAMATAVACGGFSAVCGSSLATAATMGKVALPQMRRYRYDDGLASGVIAAGGTLGILIPPSVILVLYGVTAQQDIARLFIAGIVPGLLGVLGYMAAVQVVCWRRPEAGPRAERMGYRDRFAALGGVAGILSLFVLVIGGIYAGIFTATEAAGIGATGAFVIALARRRLTLRTLLETLADTAATTTMMFMVLIGALIFSNFVNIAGLPDFLSQLARTSELPAWAILAAVLLVYLCLGMVLESLSMVLLTVPIFAPVMAGLGYDLVWFGIIVVVVTEISLITPPVGLNVFVLKTVLPDVPLSTIFRGILPFVAADVVRLALLAAVPALVLFLPDLMR